MIEINLLPESFYKLRRIKRLILLIIGMTIAIVAVFAGILALKYMSVKTLQKQVSDVEKQQQKYKNIFTELENLKTRKEQLAKQEKMLETLLQHQSVWPILLTEFNKMLPDGIWLNTLSNKLDASGSKTFSLDAVSLTRDSIADFIINLENTETSQRFVCLNIERN